MINGIEDDFVELIYNGYTVDENGNKIADRSWPAEEILNMELEERRRIVVTGTSKKFKDAYFDTMFYKTYIGPPKELAEGGYTEYDWQVPCTNMKHFYAEYISDLSKYPYYNTGRAAVVIAKYYEGARIRGSVNFDGKPISIPAQVAVRKTVEYTPDYSFPVTHDSSLIDPTDENSTGEFDLIAGAGASVSIIRNLELESPTLNTQAFVMKEINFTGPEGSDLAPITDDDAMRRDGSNYIRFLNITIDPANVSGLVYNDVNGDGNYNETIDEPVEDATLLFYEVLEFDTAQLQQNRLIPIPEQTPLRQATITDENGSYNLSGFVPGYYAINTYLDDILIGQDIIDLNSGNNTYEVIRPKKSSVKGTVYYDSDENLELNSGDEIIDNAVVELHYLSSLTQEDMLIGNVTTGTDGKYSFTDLLPGDYTIRAVDYPDYETEESVSIPENMTVSFNVSMALSPVTTSGVVRYGTEPISDIVINFDADESNETNTAESDAVSSDDMGRYEIDLVPGKYNVTVQDIRGQTLTYTFSGSLEILMGSKGGIRKDYDISLTKHSVTVSGYTRYDGSNVFNVTNIQFEPNISISNNSAMFGGTAMSDETGFYSLELSPGSYNVLVNYSTSEGTQNYTYTYEGSFKIESTDIATGYTYNIAMDRKQTN